VTGHPVTEPALLRCVHIKGGRDSVLRAGHYVILIPVGALPVLDISARAHAASCLVGTGGTDHLPASSAEVKNEWSSTPSLPYAFVVCWCRRYQVEARVLRPGLVGFLCKCHGVEVGFGRVFS
jgi:hypothetical protein